MKKMFAALLVAASCWGGYSYYHNRTSPPKSDSAEVQDPPSAGDSDAKPDPQNGPLVKMEGPLAKFINDINPFEKKDSGLRKPNPSDHIAPSPQGTSSAIVHKTFAVGSAAKFLFQVPSHAASPQLHGTYHSFVQGSDAQSSDDRGDIDFLLMNDQQYADFAQGHLGDAVYAVDSSHEQDVSFGLPATLDRPAQYYLVFRNSDSRTGKKVVQADFRVDF
jgi:hypothetical protein